MNRLIYRRARAADLLDVSESQLVKWERAGWIAPVKYPGIRAVGYAAEDVEALARRIIREGRTEVAPA